MLLGKIHKIAKTNLKVQGVWDIMSIVSCVNIHLGSKSLSRIHRKVDLWM